MASAVHPVAVAEGRGSVAIAAPVTGSMIVTGDNNTVDMHLTGAGAVLAFVFRWNRPRRRRRRDRGHPCPPRFEQHLDRDDQIAALLPIDGSPRVVNLYGPPGIGKTHVLVEALNRRESEMPDGTVYLRGAGQSADDLLHAIFDELYECRVQRRDLRIERLLSSRRAAIALEDVVLSPEDAQRVVLGAPRSRFLVTSRARVLFDGTAISLNGLAQEYAEMLAEQELGRPLEEQERRAAGSIAAALDGHPLALRQAFGRARDEGRGQRLNALEPWLLSVTAEDRIASMTPTQLRAARALAVHGEAALGDEHLAAIAGRDAVAAAVELEARHDTRSHSPRHSLAGALAQRLPQDDLVDETDRALAHFVTWTASQRGDGRALMREADALLALLARAHAAGRWEQVIRLGRAIEGAYALGQRWQAWGRILELVGDAAVRSEDLEAQGWARHQLGTRAYGLGDAAGARTSLLDALALRERIGDSAGAAATRQNLRVVAGRAPLLYRLSHMSLTIVALVCALLLGGAAAAGAGFTERVLVGKPQSAELVVGVQGEGRVVGDAGAIDCATSPPCRTEVAVGDEVVLRPHPRLGSEFARWDGPCSGLGACRLVIKGDTRVMALFKRVRQPRVVSVHVAGKGSVVSHPAGITCQAGPPCRATFKRSRRIELTAAAARGHRFDRWLGACKATARCVIPGGGSAAHVQARFVREPDSVTLAVDLRDGGVGRVTTRQSGIDCGQLCVASFRRGTRVTLTATAQPGSRFSGWNVSACKSATCTLTLTRSRTVAASFQAAETDPEPSPEQKTHELTVDVNGEGTVSTDPPALEACAADCSASFADGREVLLTADPGNGSTFDGWSHPSCDTSQTCTVTIDRDLTVEARFKRKLVAPTRHELSVDVTGEGTVRSQPGGIDCPSTCSARFPEGRVVLNAQPARGSDFTGWDERGCGSGTTCTVTLERARHVRATFERASQPTQIKITGVDVTEPDLLQTQGAGVVLQVSGRLDGAPARSTVRVSYQPPNSSAWMDATPVSTAPDGDFTARVPWTGSPEGTWTFVARYGGASGYLRSESDPRRLQIPG